MTVWKCFGAAMIFMVAVSNARATDLVQAFHYNSSGVQFFFENISDTSPSSGETMTVHLKDATRKVVIVSGVIGPDLTPDINNSIDIGMVRFDTTDIPSNAANRRILVSIGDYFADGVNNSSPYVRWGRHWGGIVTPKISGGADDARVTIRLCACVGNAIAGPIDVEELVRLETGTEIKATVHAGIAYDDITRIEAKQIYSGSDITIDSGTVESIIAFGVVANEDSPSAIASEVHVLDGNLVLLQCGTSGSATINGDFTGSVSVPNGKVETLVCYNGSIIGPASTSGTPDFKVSAKNGIDSVTADAIDCDIITNYNTPTASGLGYLGSLTTNTGDYTGVLKTRGVGIPSGAGVYQINIADDVNGTFTIDESVQSVTGLPAITIGGELTSSSRVLIGDYLKGSSSDGGAIFAASGLKGQVVINRNGGSTVSTDYWEADVEVTSGATLSTNFYSTTSSTLGGGAVGVVPYNMYREDSVLRSTADTLPSNSSTNPIAMSADVFEDGFDLTFYGPIKLRNSSYKSLQLLNTANFNGSTYVADLTCRTNQTIAPSGVSGSRAARTIRVQSDPATPLPVGLYKLTSSSQLSGIGHFCEIGDPVPTYTYLDCDLTASGVTKRVANFEVWFKIVYDLAYCPADIDNDGDYTNGGTPDAGVDINDLLTFLGAFEAGNIIADIDNGTGTGTPDAGVDINDLLFFLYHFELGC